VRDEEDIERELRAELADAPCSEGETSSDEARLTRSVVEVRAVACGRCGDFHSEPELSWLDYEPWCQACLRTIARAPWNPALIAGICFFLGFSSAGVLTAVNRRRLGYEVRLALRVCGWLVLGGLVAALAALLPEGVGQGVGFGVNIAAIFHFRRVGAARFDALKGAGAPTGSTLAAIGIAVTAFVPVFATMLILVFGAELLFGTTRPY
jgi:hypothetical protein